jgi:hypothetical protein
VRRRHTNIQGPISVFCHLSAMSSKVLGNTCCRWNVPHLAIILTDVTCSSLYTLLEIEAYLDLESMLSISYINTPRFHARTHTLTSFLWGLSIIHTYIYTRIIFGPQRKEVTVGCHEFALEMLCFIIYTLHQIFGDLYKGNQMGRSFSIHRWDGKCI